MRVFLLRLLIWGLQGGACREESGGGAGWGIVEGAIGCLSVVVVGAFLCLSKPLWLFVMVGTCGHSLIMVMAPCSSIVVVGSCSHSLIVVVGGCNHSLILVAGPCCWWGWVPVAACRSLWWPVDISGRLSLSIDYGGGFLWPIKRGCGPSSPCIDGGAGYLWTLVGSCCHFLIVVVGPHGQLSMVVGVVRREQ